ncbi:M20 family metallo-hydrolase [Salarchaeum sp. JOR-1]|uniref:M20 family metallo-hydrolase n=1 Tax=Salarchaeum sp. JOR-1 TaxID=2599399 RepID=UPI00119848A2|nr:M20 family metallo-hydrolase [Salarchaeum sp. JOR-1]QDX39575.1 M20 family metallo-hydrolase [Salarchaeum sp. JOR-1]
MDVSLDRLRDDIEANAAFGATGDTGRTNLTGSDANRDARDHLVARMEDAGLDVRVDAVGNIAGRWVPASADADAPAVASGSHLDSVPNGGIFDGPLGVYGALEAVRALRESDTDLARPIEVVSFTEEEGASFAPGLLGSSVATGERDLDTALGYEHDGRTLDAALSDIGYRGDGVLDAGAWDAWVELHIEQGTRLESAGANAGVVTDITGITHCEAVVEGQADHAGATPMDARTDALAAASEFVLDVEDAATDAAGGQGTAVGTVGSLDVSPNATNVVPGRVELGVDVRDVAYDTMDDVVAAARDSLDRLESERGVNTSLSRPFDVPPAPMAERVRDAATDAAEENGQSSLALHSGAAHDTMHVARVTDAGLLFAPSEGGFSHSPREWTDWADCRDAVRVLAGTLARLAGR